MYFLSFDLLFCVFSAPYQLYNSNTDVPADSAVNVPNGYWVDINTPAMYPDESESDYQQGLY
jgi:hypothetical protein